MNSLLFIGRTSIKSSWSPDQSGGALSTSPSGTSVTDITNRVVETFEFEKYLLIIVRRITYNIIDLLGLSS